METLDNFNVKIIDFGLAKPIRATMQHEDCKGTPGYMAPECFMSFVLIGDNVQFSKEYSLKIVDIFVVGKIFENIIMVENFKFVFIFNGYVIQAEFLKLAKSNSQLMGWLVKYGRLLVLY